MVDTQNKKAATKKAKPGELLIKLLEDNSVNQNNICESVGINNILWRQYKFKQANEDTAIPGTLRDAFITGLELHIKELQDGLEKIKAAINPEPEN